MRESERVTCVATNRTDAFCQILPFTTCRPRILTGLFYHRKHASGMSLASPGRGEIDPDLAIRRSSVDGDVQEMEHAYKEAVCP